jgi:hypothetical protein
MFFYESCQSQRVFLLKLFAHSGRQIFNILSMAFLLSDLMLFAVFPNHLRESSFSITFNQFFVVSNLPPKYKFQIFTKMFLFFIANDDFFVEYFI